MTKKGIIYETLGSTAGMQIVESHVPGEVRLSGVFGVCGIKNGNNRIYEKSNYGKMVGLMQERMKSESILGELEHPNTMNITLENVSHMIEDIQMNEDGTVTGTIRLLDTPKGQIAKAIIEGEGLPNNWKPDKLIIEAINFYKSLKSTSALLLEDTRAVIDNVRKTLREFSFDDMEDKDRVNAIKSVASTIATIPKLIKDLDEAEKAVTSEMQNTSGKVRGQKEKSLLEDGIL